MIKFGTDGWRAIIAEDFTFENVKILSQAIADYLYQQGQGKKKVVVGYDCRFLSKEFAQTAALVLSANNIKVVVSNKPVPTPAVSFHCRYRKYDLGIMLTASHNPASFNGLKIKTQEGGSADKEVTDQVERLLHKTKVKWLDLADAKKSKYFFEEDLTADCMAFLKKYVDVNAIKKLKLRVLVDIMYGSGDNYAEQIIGKSNIDFEYIHNEFNPSFKGINPEPTAVNLAELMMKVKHGKYDLGIALDGDADRIAMVDSSGNYVNAQVILPLLAQHMIQNRGVKGGIGKTVVGSNIIDKLALALGVPCYETPVGFKYLSQLFKEDLIAVGGEEAGGIGFKGYIPERDGSVAFLLMLEMMAYEGKTFDQLLSQLYTKYGRWYYSRMAIPVKSVKKGLDSLKLPKQLLGEKVERVNTLDGIKLITQHSWLMFRKSGTEPIVRVYSESKTRARGEALVKLGTKMVYDL